MDPEVALRAAAAILGALVAARALYSAIRTIILPRSSNDWVTRVAFIAVRAVLDLIAPPKRPYAWRDRVFAYFGPVGLLAAALTWILLVFAGFTLLFWGTGTTTLGQAARESGSALLTLGFYSPPGGIQTALTFIEAVLGLGLAALLVTYLPTIHGAFSRREVAVNLLEVRADSPASAVAMLERYQRLGRWDALHLEWERWEVWFAELEESHTSIAALAFYRSTRATNSWITAAGAVMDAAALSRSLLDIPRDVQADLAIRAGFVALRSIADFFGIAYDPHPAQGDPTSVTREKFDLAAFELEAAGLPLKEDRDQAFRDFNGWRVNYDRTLLAISRLIVAPVAHWNGTSERESLGRVQLNQRRRTA
ncbi:MAG: hypothetical protein HY264_04040 [Chloroflexi bacterium]|nr:hypothetical protein [Chloroflexota bacterium]